MPPKPNKTAKVPPANQPNNGAKTQPTETQKLNPQLVKATLMALNKEAPDIEVMFNPTEISFSRSVNWISQVGNRGTSLLPKINFSGVEPYQLTLQQLLFDTYETKESVVTKYIKNIRKGVESIADPNNQRPPVYIFIWGENKYFHCVIQSLTYTLTMFLTDGTPVRALVDIQLQEVDQNDFPPSQGPVKRNTASQGSVKRNTNGRNTNGRNANGRNTGGRR